MIVLELLRIVHALVLCLVHVVLYVLNDERHAKRRGVDGWIDD